MMPTFIALHRAPARFLLPTAVLLLLAATPLGSQSLQPRADSIFARFEGGPGCAVEVRRGDDVLARGGYGIADLEWQVGIAPETIFEAGSVSKQFVAASILLLEARGVLSLDDEVQQWFPEIPRYDQPITIRHLLHHTSGLRDWGAVAALAGWPRTTRRHTHDDVLAIAARQRGLNHDPGERFAYTNTGYNLMAMLVDRATHRSLADFTREEFFEPLGMRHTSWRDNFARVVPGRAQAYTRAGGAWYLAMPFENVHGNGGLLTTVGDLLTWTDALAEGRLGTPEVGTAMRRMGLLNDGSASGYGGGLFLGPVRGVPAVRHTGSTAGYRAVLSWWPEQDLSSAILCNTVTGNPSPLEQALLAPVLPFAASTPPQQPTRPEPFPIDPARYAEFVGDYHSDEVAGTMRVRIEGGSLAVSRREGQAPTRMLPTGADRFAVGGGTMFHFERDDSGGVRRVVVSVSRAQDVSFLRVP
jgi:CubicO group peptidase (beta-lactamase class C family)